MRSSDSEILVLHQTYSVVFDNRTRPIVTIELLPFTSKGKPMRLFCLLDTGADFNILPKTIADTLGHEVPCGVGQPRNLNGIDGGTTGHIHTNEIVFCGEKFVTDFIVCDDWRNESIGLLGLYGAAVENRGFFSKFNVYFNTSEQYCEIYKPDNSKTV